MTHWPLTAHADSNASAVSSNPAAVNTNAGSGELQKFIEKKLNIKNNYGINFDGAWVGDFNNLFSGGTSKADRQSVDSLLILGMTIDTQKLLSWQGGLFGVQLLQFNGQDINQEAGTVQGYNSLPGPQPLNRSELYQLWFRQELFCKKLIVRLGKVVPTLDFNNVMKPVPLQQENVSIPAVTSLIYTPIFVNASMLGVLPGYYNSAYGATINFVPVDKWYLSLGIYDGSLAQGIQTGLTGPIFNNSYFHIGETGFTWLLGKEKLPGTVGLGGWHQSGQIIASPTLTENGASGYYLFGSQRLWYKNPGANNSGISGFYQFGANNSGVLPMSQYAGAGFTFFGLVPQRINDSMGLGGAYSWLNQNIFPRRTELLLQAYYQAEVIQGIYAEPVLSYIPHPGAQAGLNAAWAGTFRVIVVF